MATRMQQRRGTASQWTSANPVLAAGEIGFEIDTNKFKMGDGINQWEDLDYFLDQTSLDGSLGDYVPLSQKGVANGVATLDGSGSIPVSQLGNLIADAPELLDTLEEISAALGDDPNFVSKVVPIVKKTTAEWEADTSIIPLGTIAYNTTLLGLKVGNGINDFAGLEYLMNNAQVQASVDASITTAVTGLLEDTIFSGDITLPSTTSIGPVSGTEISYLNGVTASIQGQLDDLVAADVSIQDELADKAATSNPTFDGTVVLPTTTSIGDVSSTEIGYLNGVTSGIQGQLDTKLASATASSTYAPLNDPTFSGNVSLPSTTTIGDVSSTELGYVNGVTSAIQTQLDAKAPTADPTFTGTVSGVTKSHVGLGNVDNTADTDKPVSTATQTALDAKASLSGATFTGDVTVETDLIVDGNLTVTGTTTTVSAQDLVVSDPLIYIGEGNTGNLVDIGIVGNFNDGTYQHSGIVRDASAGKWKLFKGVADEPTTTVNFAQGSLDDIAVNNVEVSGVVFSDGTQTKQGVPSITTISQKTSSYTLSNLNERDTIIEMGSSSALNLTVPNDSSVNYPVGTTLDVIQTGSGQVTVVGAAGVTINATPGFKLRTQWSTATLLKRSANTWLAFGDLTA
jgi:hypothetical protein